MRSSCLYRENQIDDCPCCELSREVLDSVRSYRSEARRTKSSDAVKECVNIEIFQEPKELSGYWPENLYRRDWSSRSSLYNTVSHFSTSGKNSCGIWQRCHDSGSSRTCWSMENSYRETQIDKFESSHIAEGQEKHVDNRIFPFQPTPSGNLKVIPQQVVFESKKVSVLVADPRHTKVNIKAELAKQQALAEGSLEVPKDRRVMESEEARNMKKHQILNAITLMGGEVRGAALSQFMPPGMPPGMTMPLAPKFKISAAGSTDDGPYAGVDDLDRDDGKSIDSDEIQKAEINLIKLGFTVSPPIDWGKVKLPQKTNLYKHMHYRITNYVNPDCLVQIDDVQFNCHLLVLQCYSAFFNEKTAKDVVKLPPENVSPKAFELIYEWMTYVHGDSYTILTRENILEVFLAAQFLGIKELEEQCWAFVDCEELFKEDTAFMLYLDAKKYGISAIMELMIPRVMKFFLALVSSKDFLDLHLDEVHVLLSSNYISVHSEIEVFMSAVRWLWHDWKERKECLEQIMSCVRFGLIAPWQLVDIRRNPENPEFLEITSHPGVQQMIDNGLAYAIIKYWYGNQTEDYYHWIELLGLSEPPSRNWAGEEKNYVTYREFLHDLEMYRKELAQEKDKWKTKRESGKSKRGGEQSGMTTSPRDGMQQQTERRTVTKKHSPIPIKASSLADAMRSEIVNRFVERKPKSSIFAPPPPTIWNANTYLKEMPLLRNWEKLETIEEQRRFGRLMRQSSSTQTFPVDSDQSLMEISARKKSSKLLGNSPRSNINGLNLNSMLRREQAAVIIQRAFRSFRHRMRRPSQPKSGFNGRLSKHCRKSESYFGGSIGKSRSKSISNYLKDGSLFFAGRESVLVFGGIDPHTKYGDGKNTGKNIFRYNSEMNQWDLVGELPEPRHHHSVAFLKGRVYLAGGTDPRDDERGKTVVVSTVWSFEPISRSWFEEAEMQTARKNFGLTVINGQLHAIGGQDKNGRVLSSVERYDIVVKAWEYVAPLNVERTGAASARYRESIWVAGGMTNSRKSPLTQSVESYDPKLNVWVHQSPLRFPRCFGCLFSMNDVLYMIGGAGRASEKERTTSSCNAIDVWNPREEEWKLHFAMSIPRHGHAVAYLGTQILIIGGVTTAYLRALTDIECFCCERKTWVKGLANLPVPLSGHGVVTLPPASLM